MDAAVKVDDVVVADGGETALAVPAVDVGDCEGLAFGGGGAMDYYICDFTHDDWGLLGRIGPLLMLMLGGIGPLLLLMLGRIGRMGRIRIGDFCCLGYSLAWAIL